MPNLVAWHQDLVNTGAAQNKELKVFVLGNGGAGKTQISRRLQSKDFDPGIPSTHGVMLGRFPLLKNEEGEISLYANLWDFGGQDVYLGTHSLFLDERAVYVIVWTPEKENDCVFEENGVPMRNRPLAYWLAYVRSLAGKDAPVIVVQSQCDRESDGVEPPIPADHGFGRLRRTACSAKSAEGMDLLVPELRAAARLLQERYDQVRLPKSWVALGAALRARRDEGVKTLSWEAFKTLTEEGHGTASVRTVAEYLHRAGQVFWRSGAFDDQVVLDQAWALEGMYAVLDRSTTLPLIRNQGGVFTRELLGALVWKSYDGVDQQLFLSLMQQCGTCFAVAKGHYVAPALLPEFERIRSRHMALWQDRVATVEVRLSYEFLHEGIVKAVLCAVGERAGEQGVYWSGGTAYYDEKVRGPVEICADFPEQPASSHRGDITIRLAAGDGDALVDHLLDSIQRASFGKPPEVVWVKGKSKGDRHLRGEETGTEPPLPAFAAISPAVAPSDGGPEIYVSYAWGGESEKTVDTLERKLRGEGYEVRRDKRTLRPGDWISEFMAEIGRAKVVLVVLSANYLASHYCMTELLHLYHRELGDRRRMLQHIVPVVLEDAAISSPVSRLEKAKYWQGEYVKLKKATEGLDALAWGESTRQQLLGIEQYKHCIVDILAWLNDVLMPRGTQLIHDDYEPVLALVNRLVEERE